MKMQIKKILTSGLSFTHMNGKLKIIGASSLVEKLKPLIIEYKQQIIETIENPLLNSRLVPQSKIDVVVHRAAILADQLKLDQREAELYELEKAFNTVEYAEYNGNDIGFNYALQELENLTNEYTKERRVA